MKCVCSVQESYPLRLDEREQIGDEVNKYLWLKIKADGLESCLEPKFCERCFRVSSSSVDETTHGFRGRHLVLARGHKS